MRGLAGERLPAAEHVPQPGARGGVRLREEDLQHRRNEVAGGDGPFVDQPGQIGGVLVAARLRDDQCRTLAQRPEELPYGHVERRGRLLQHPVVRRQPVAVLHPAQPVVDRAVRHDDALRTAGGPRGVDDVRRMDGCQRTRRIAPRVTGDVESVQDDLRGRHAVGKAAGAVGDHADGRRVPQHVRDPLRRVLRVERQIRGSRLQHGEQRDDQLHGARHRHGHHGAGPGTQGPQVPGQPVGAGVQLRVGQGGVPVHQRGRVRGAGGLRLDRSDQRRRRQPAVGPVELIDDQRVFGGGRDAVRGERGVRVRRGQPVHEVQEALLMGGEGVLVVQGRIAVEVDAQPAAVRAVVDVDGQVVHRPGGQIAGPDRRTREVHVVVEGHHVDERTHQPPVLAEQPQIAADVLVAVALMAAHLTDAHDDLAHQLGEAPARGDGQPQRQDVHHHAGHAQRDRPDPAHHGQPEHHLGAGGRPGGVERLRGDQHLRPGRAEPRREFPHPVGGVRTEVGGAAQERARRQRATAREPRHLGPVGEGLGPVGAVGRERFRRPVAGVLLDEAGERSEGPGNRLMAPDECRVDLGRAPDEQGVAEAVHDEVMDPLVPEPAFLPGTEERVPEQRPGRQVARLGEVGAHPRLRLPAGVGHAAQVVHGEREVDRGGDDLTRPLRAVLDPDAQRVRLGGDPAQCRRENRRVERSVDLQALRGVLRRTEGIERLRVPHARLGGGQRQYGVRPCRRRTGAVGEQDRHETPSSGAQASMAGCSARSAKSARTS